MDIIAINKVRDGRWAVHYNYTCECGCKTTREILIVEQADKPTEKKVKKLIDARHKN